MRIMRHDAGRSRGQARSGQVKPEAACSLVGWPFPPQVYLALSNGFATTVSVHTDVHVATCDILYTQVPT